jgi:hypothetical protein
MSSGEAALQENLSLREVSLYKRAPFERGALRT